MVGIEAFTKLNNNLSTGRGSKVGPDSKHILISVDYYSFCVNISLNVSAI